MKKIDTDEIVIFRVWTGGSHTVIALWPYNSVSSDPADGCPAYEHIGQHGSADYRNVLSLTRPARVYEYKALLAELKERGYKPVIRKRANLSNTFLLKSLSAK